MILLGALFAVSGGLVLHFSRPLHEGWRDMTRTLRASGIQNTLPLTEWMASERGFRWLRRIGSAVLVAGLVMSAVGAVRLALA